MIAMAARTKVLARAAVVALVLGVLVALLVSPRRQTGPTAQPGAPPPKNPLSPSGLVLTTAASLKERVTRTRRQGVLVGAWASWCGSCREDVPLLIAMGRRYHGKLDVLLVTVDEPETEPRAVEMLREFGAPGPSFVVDGPLEAFKAGLYPRWPGMLPATFLFDPEARVRHFWGGPPTESELTSILERYLRGETVDGESNFGLAPGTVTP